MPLGRFPISEFTQARATQLTGEAQARERPYATFGRALQTGLQSFLTARDEINKRTWELQKMALEEQVKVKREKEKAERELIHKLIEKHEKKYEYYKPAILGRPGEPAVDISGMPGIPELGLPRRQPLPIGLPTELAIQQPITAPEIPEVLARPEELMPLETYLEMYKTEIEPEGWKKRPTKGLTEYQERSLKIREAGVKLRQASTVNRELSDLIRIYNVNKNQYIQTLLPVYSAQMEDTATKLTELYNRMYPDTPVTIYEMGEIITAPEKAWGLIPERREKIAVPKRQKQIVNKPSFKGTFIGQSATKDGTTFTWDGKEWK